MIGSGPRWRGFLVVALVLSLTGCSWSGVAWAQQVGDRLLLVERAQGVPSHPGPGDRGISHRFPGGIPVTVTGLDAATGWFEVRDDSGNAGWIIRAYLGAPVAAVPTGPTAAAESSYNVGTRNERAMIVERVHAGLRRARAEGKRLGRPRIPENTESAIRRELAKGRGIHSVARALGVGRGTVQRVRAEASAAWMAGARTRVSVTTTFSLGYSVGWRALAPQERDPTKTCNPSARAVAAGAAQQ
jgi:hypothetical protein